MAATGPAARLALVLGALPEGGRIAVLNPRDGAGLELLDPARLHLFEPFRPDHDALAARGLAVSPAPDAADRGAFQAAIVFLPRAKALGRALIAEAALLLAPGAPLLVDGARLHGVEPLLKDLGARVSMRDTVSKAHGRAAVLAAPAPDLLADWAAADLAPAPGFVTRPGVFSADAVDRGSALLAAALPDALPARMADLGAGWGWLGAQVLARKGVAQLDLVEADHIALGCARRNIADPRAVFHWADARFWRPETPLGGVVMNPPFHAGRDADPGLGAAFIAAAAGALAPEGRLWMVANRHLPYEAVLAAHFAEARQIGLAEGFKLIEAHHPRRQPAPAAAPSGAALRRRPRRRG